MATTTSTDMIARFDEIRSSQIAESQRRAFPRVVYALNAIDAIYLYSVPDIDFFLRRDGSVWAAIGPAGPPWRDEALQWQELDAQQRTGVLAYTVRSLAPARVLPEMSELLPERPVDAIACPDCRDGRTHTVILYTICSRCLDLGWIPSAT